MSSHSLVSKNTRQIKTKNTSLGMYQLNGFKQFFPLIYDWSSAMRSSFFYTSDACSMNKRIYCMDGTRIPGTHDSHPRQRDLCFFQPFLTRVFARLFFFNKFQKCLRYEGRRLGIYILDCILFCMVICFLADTKLLWLIYWASTQ